ncbi:hypothetical protein CKO23_11975 [Thiocystis violacea]|nr:hypothetical protein [Thiocystis violacea]
MPWPGTRFLRSAPILVALVFPMDPAQSQLADAGFRIVISKAGEDCEAIEKTQAIGTVSSGDTLVAVACSGAGQYVVRIHKDNSLSYMTSCEEFKSQTGIRCFAGK